MINWKKLLLYLVSIGSCGIATYSLYSFNESKKMDEVDVSYPLDYEKDK